METALNIIAGKYQDGKTALTHNVFLRVSSHQLIILNNSHELLTTWTLAEIHLTEKLGNSGQIRLQNGYGNNDRLILPNSDSFAELEKHCPKIHKVSAPIGDWKKISAWSFSAVAAVTLLVMVIIPAISKNIAQSMSVELEEKIGTQVYANITKVLAVTNKDKSKPLECSDEASLQALNKLASQMAKRFPDSASIKVRVLNSTIKNAIALPGGYIVIFKGLLNDIKSPDELAGIMAHEIAHVVQRHALTAAMEKAGISALVGLLVGDATGGTLVAGLTLAILSSSYTKELEIEADKIAIQIMNDQRLNSLGWSAFFKRLENTETNLKELEGFLEFFSTHPPSKERAELIEKAAQPGKPAFTDQSWTRIKKMCE